MRYRSAYFYNKSDFNLLEALQSFFSNSLYFLMLNFFIQAIRLVVAECIYKLLAKPTHLAIRISGS